MQDLFDSLLGERGPGPFAGFRQPKDEHLLSSFEKRLKSRVACNVFIIEKLRKDGAA